MINKNPFSVNRAEYMKNLWKYYVPFKEFPDNVDKSVVVVGGRGTGKSMFFLCNSWREKISSLEETCDTPVKAFLEQNQIGIYYKVDSTFVGAMSELEQDNQQWRGYFNTYLSISLLLDLIPLIDRLYKEGILSADCVNKVTSTYTRVVHGRDDSLTTLEKVKNDCFSVLQKIEDLINGDSDSSAFRATQPGTIFKSIVDVLHETDELSESVFKIYIDEYESFSEWQQKIINTLIKQSNHLLIYNIGMRHNGMKTKSTLGENEILQATHDFFFFNFDDLLNGKDYEDSLKVICQKRFEMFFESQSLSANMPSTDIEFYLSTYNISLEIERLEDRKFTFKKNLERVIAENCESTDNSQLMIEALCNKAPILNARLHLALLLRAPQYRPKVDELYHAYIAWNSGKTNRIAKKYQEWLHNAKNGLIYLLAKDCGVGKLYYGFDTFVALSSGVVRYFLELCEQTFNIAMMEGFSWGDPKQISPDIQTRAAKYVSQYKVNEIASYPVCGKRLRIFVQCFGEICRDLHRNEKSTLGEPEINHFTTESLQLSPDVEKALEDAVTCLVLQKLPQTKSKESLRTDILDYHLNKIYTPYFEISFKKKRKIKFDVNLLEQLLSSDIDIANRAAKNYLDKYWGRKTKIPPIPKLEATEVQLNLFEEGGYDN